MAWNQNRSTSQLKLFEIGKQFRRQADGTLHEALALGVILAGGDDRGLYWDSAQKSWDFYAIKGVIEGLAHKFHLALSLEPMAHPFLQQGMAAEVKLNAQSLGFAGEVAKKMRDQWDLEMPVFALEMGVAPLNEAASRRVAFQPIPKFPTVKRDIAFVMDEAVSVGVVRDLISQSGGEACIGVDLFDLYRGDQIPQGQKSAAFALTFLSPDRTLTDKEIDPLVKAVVEQVTTQFSARLRT